MRVLSPKGRVYKVNSVIPLVEKKEKFNERVTAVREPAANMDVMPTAISFKLLDESCPFGYISFVVGNLPPEKVKLIISDMLIDGYCDLSNLKYQKVCICDVKNLKIDGGKSLPYFEENCPAFDFEANIPKFGRPGVSYMDSEFDGEEDDSDFEEDEENSID